LQRIDGRAKAERDIAEIKTTLAEEKGTWSELVSPGTRMALIVGTGLCLFQGWSGGTAVNFYAPLIFQRASSVGASRAILWTLLLNVSSVLLTTLTMFLVDKVGRRPLLLIGSAGMALALFSLGIALQSNVPGIYAILFVFLFNMFYQISVAPLAWLILSEIFPMRLRARGQSIGTLAVWVSTYLSDQFLAPMMTFFQTRFGSVGPAFWVFGVVCVGILLFGWTLVPETKQRSLEEIASWWHRRESEVTID
jgi:SP family arabinose:H+ symporter-like MFS transporter